MEKIKKDLKTKSLIRSYDSRMLYLKLISIIIAFIFSFESVGYCLRVPLNTKRVKEVLQRTISSTEVEGVIMQPAGKHTRRNVLLIIGGSAAIVTTGVVLKEVDELITGFTFDKSKIFPQKNELPQQYDLQNITYELSLIKDRKMEDRQVIAYCKKADYKILWLTQKLSEGRLTFEHVSPIIDELMHFLKGTDVNGTDSVSVRWEINLVKEVVMNLFSIILKDVKTPLEKAEAIIETLNEMIAYKDNFDGLDAKFTKYFPLIVPAQVLSNAVAENAYNALERVKYNTQRSRPLVSQSIALLLNEKTRPEETSADRIVRAFFRLYGTPMDFEDRLAEIKKSEGENMHFISPDDKDAIEEIRKLSRQIMEFCINSANAHNLPPRLLVAKIFYSSKSTWNISAGIGVLKKRGAVSAGLVRFLEFILPEEVLKYRPKSEYNDFLGGVILDGKTTIGITQMRPAWVKRYQAWQRFGIDATKLSNRQISRMLLNPKYSIEATAKMLRSLIEETKKHREEAIKYDISPDMSSYNQESVTFRQMQLYGPVATAEYYRLLPEPIIFGSEDWIMATFHPMYSEWARSSLRLHILITKSGILDNKLVRIIGESKFPSHNQRSLENYL